MVVFWLLVTGIIDRFIDLIPLLLTYCDAFIFTIYLISDIFNDLFKIDLT